MNSLVLSVAVLPSGNFEEGAAVNEKVETQPDIGEFDNEAPVAGQRRQGERRQNEERREGARGLWEERRLLDRREREYSLFGKRMDGDDNETDIANVPNVEDEQLLSATEIEIFREQDQAQQRAEEHENDIINSADEITS
jgi:hypothetical protein